jgi:hypothetical protein
MNNKDVLEYLRTSVSTSRNDLSEVVLGMFTDQNDEYASGAFFGQQDYRRDFSIESAQALNATLVTPGLTICDDEMACSVLHNFESHSTQSN